MCERRKLRGCRDDYYYPSSSSLFFYLISNCIFLSNNKFHFHFLTDGIGNRERKRQGRVDFFFLGAKRIIREEFAGASFAFFFLIIKYKELASAMFVYIYIYIYL